MLDNGYAGVLVPASSPDRLSDAIVGLLTDPCRRAQFAARFQNRVEELYSPRRIIARICDVYEAVLKEAQ